MHVAIVYKRSQEIRRRKLFPLRALCSTLRTSFPGHAVGPHPPPSLIPRPHPPSIPGVQLHDSLVGVLHEPGVGGAVQLLLHSQSLLQELEPSQEEAALGVRDVLRWRGGREGEGEGGEGGGRTWYRW